MTRIWTGVAVAVVALAGALPAGAAIELGKGIDGVQLGDSLRAVRHKLGRPDIQEETHPRVFYLFYGRRQLSIQVGRHGVFEISTSSPHEHTASGLGPGSTRAALRRRLPGLRCKADCTLSRPGSKTVFVFGAKPRVVTVSIRRT